jgi:hypothetical protein
VLRLSPLFAPVWVSRTVGALKVLFSRPPLIRIRTGSSLLPMLTRYQVTGRWRAAHERVFSQSPFGVSGSYDCTLPTGASSHEPAYLGSSHA